MRSCLLQSALVYFGLKFGGGMRLFELCLQPIQMEVKQAALLTILASKGHPE